MKTKTQSGFQIHLFHINYDSAQPTPILFLTSKHSKIYPRIWTKALQIFNLMNKRVTPPYTTKDPKKGVVNCPRALSSKETAPWTFSRVMHEKARVNVQAQLPYCLVNAKLWQTCDTYIKPWVYMMRNMNKLPSDLIVYKFNISKVGKNMRLVTSWVHSIMVQNLFCIIQKN